MTRIVTGLTLSGLMLLCGCDSTPEGRLPTAPVNVLVTYKGQPVADAVVTFTLPTSPPPAFGKTDANGKASLTTYEAGDGALIGKHTVMVVKQEFDGTVKDQGSQDGEDYNPSPGASPIPKVKDLLPKKYALPGSTPLNADVVKGENEFTFDLTD